MTILLRIIRAPFVLVSLLVGTLLLFGFLSSISVGEWCEQLLKRLGYRGNPYWIPGLFGVGGFVCFGVLAPAIGGNALIGWPGIIAGPIIAVLIISRLDYW